MSTKTNKNPLARTFRFSTPILASTNGRGYWSDEKRTTKICTVAFDDIYGDLDPFRPASGKKKQPWIGVNLNVFFTNKDWNNDKHGLIYTDNKWLKEFREGFIKRMKGFKPVDLDYTEQGMQGKNYVSLCFYVNGMPNIKAFAHAFGIPMSVIEKEFSA